MLDTTIPYLNKTWLTSSIQKNEENSIRTNERGDLEEYTTVRGWKRKCEWRNKLRYNNSGMEHGRNTAALQ